LACTGFPISLWIEKERLSDMADESYRDGMKVRRQVLGDKHVDAAVAGTTEFDEDYQRFITEGAWGSVWNRPGLTPATRSLLTIALLAASGHTDEVAMHVRATANTGATPAEVRETLLHVAVYAGVPAANRAFAVAKEAYAAMADDDKGGT
jgi:4-carboxymuconolactone decarboxylase